MKTILFFATLVEALPTIHYCKAVASPKSPHEFIFPAGKIVCTGIGLEKAAFCASKYVQNGVSWINAGVAGSIVGSHEIGSIVYVDRVGCLSFDPQKGTYAPIEQMHRLSTKKGVALFSSPSPLYFSVDTGYDECIVDMEAYSIASRAKECGIPLKVIKIISDRCTCNSSKEIQERISKLSDRLALVLFLEMFLRHKSCKC
jgi:nucleoside phosphorylase